MSVVDEVRQTLLSLDAQVQLLLFGSRARAQQHGIAAPTDSDWDFLVLISNNEPSGTALQTYRGAYKAL